MKLVLSIILIISSNVIFGQEFKNENIKWFDYYWDGDSTHPKDAMILKSKIDTVNFDFCWQFDTGSPRTFVYGNVWNSFTNAFPFLKEKFFVIDSLKNDGFINLKNDGVYVSGKRLPKNIIGYLPDYGNFFEKDIILDNLGASIILGTIGIDIFRNGVLIIDFRKNQIGYTDKLSQEFYTKQQNTVDFTLYQNRIIIPIKIGNEVFYFFYDSGASLFPLKTTSTFSNLSKLVNYSDTLYNITTWGKSYNVPGGNINSAASLGKLKIKNPKIYVHPDPELYHTKIFEEANTCGLIGNAYFENKIIIIDFTKMKFTIL